MTNNEKIKQLIKRYGLSHRELSALVLQPADSTRAWTCRPDRARFTVVSAGTVKLLQLQIKDKGIKPVQ